MQSIVENNIKDISEDLARKLVKDSKKELLSIRFSVGEGISNIEKFKSLFLKELFCNTPCGLSCEEKDDYLDELRKDLILNKQEYL